MFINTTGKYYNFKHNMYIYPDIVKIIDNKKKFTWGSET